MQNKFRIAKLLKCDDYDVPEYNAMRLLPNPCLNKLIIAQVAKYIPYVSNLNIITPHY